MRTYNLKPHPWPENSKLSEDGSADQCWVVNILVISRKIGNRTIKLMKFVIRAVRIGLTSYHDLVLLQATVSDRSNNDLNFLLTMPSSHSRHLLLLLNRSESQLRQDLFVLSKLQFKRGGISSSLVPLTELTLVIPTYSKKNFPGRGYLRNRLRYGTRNFERIGQMH